MKVDKKKLGLVAITVGALALSGAAMASGGGGVDVSAATDAFASGGDAVETLGKAMLTFVGAGIIYKWVTAFLI